MVLPKLTAPGRRRPDLSPRSAWRGAAALITGPNRLFVFVGLAIAVAFFTPLATLGVLALLVVVGIVVGGSTRLAALAVFVMALFAISPRYIFPVWRTTPAILAALGCLFLWLGGRAANFTSDLRTRVVPVTLGFAGIMLASYALGISRPLRPIQIEIADQSMIILLGMLGVTLLTAELIQDRVQLDRILAAFLVGATLTSVAAVLQSVADFNLAEVLRVPLLTDRGELRSAVQLRLGQVRAVGLARHPIELGTTLAMALPIGLHYAAFARSQRSRTAAMASVLLILLAMLMSISRSAILGLAVVLVLILPTWDSGRRFRFYIAAAAAVLAMFMVLPNLLDTAWTIASDWQGETIENANIEGRTEDYAIVRGLVADHPLLGSGYGTHVSADSFATDNQYLDTLIETGILGVAALLAWLLTGIGAARRSAKAALDPATRDLSLALAVSIASGMVSFAAFDGLSFQVTAGALAFLIGCAGAVHQLTHPSPNDSSSPVTA